MSSVLWEKEKRGKVDETTSRNEEQVVRWHFMAAQIFFIHQLCSFTKNHSKNKKQKQCPMDIKIGCPQIISVKKSQWKQNIYFNIRQHFLVWVRTKRRKKLKCFTPVVSGPITRAEGSHLDFPVCQGHTYHISLIDFVYWMEYWNWSCFK